MNVHESEKLAGILEANGYYPAEDEKDADIIVLNTCCIRENAENRVLGNLGRIKKLREVKKDLKVCVCGCMTQNRGTAVFLKKRCPFINIIFGTHNIHKFGEYLRAVENGEKSLVEIFPQQDGTTEGLPLARSNGTNAWVNIMYGCNNFCSYCIVPYVRGTERSRKPDAIIDEVKKLLDNGYKEITLLGQNVNSYKSEDKNGIEVNFASLLRSVAGFPQKYRVRFMTSHPKDLSDEVIRTISEHPNIPEYIHLPAQSGSDRILELMNRKYNKLDYFNRIETIKRYIPDAGLSGDIIVGFPSETENDFLETLQLVTEVKYNNLYTFIYSRRNGTKADSMENHISEEIKSERIKRLIKLQTDIGYEIAKNEIGHRTEVLCDTYDKKTGILSGRTRNGKTVHIKSDKNLTGEFILADIVSAKNTALNGVIANC
jgi:tRNA-2-methylthio-N6-dimethylallyladenosine synthase